MVDVAGVKIGNGNPIVVQSMIKRPINEVDTIINDIARLQKAGCELIRVAVPDRSAIKPLTMIVRGSPLPVIGDIHFHAELAIAAIKTGVAKIRINPGNIKRDGLVEIARLTRKKNLPVRIGVNAGSIDRKRFPEPTVDAMVTTLKEAIEIFEGTPLVLSAKSSDVLSTLEIYRRINDLGLPLHIGITEAGPPFRGGIRSGVGLGILLAEGIGDTIRVSLTGDPVLEVIAAYEILRSLNLREYGPLLISCPICGRCKVDLLKIVTEVEAKLKGIRTSIKIAVMGCEVNGPGEAKDADIGIAFGKGSGLIFKKGVVIRKVRENEAIRCLFENL
ncbi:MAG TPA: flavodoxin-dependent (E)-4-hydroxy-3-methylbut-2-enyl-diphosphate synthase [bacterium (Candidatus Stahlbacteria)]|nr:flavodoxin-dependent (E)-4-hydroxy-3-methylbut-2-enyl-diphosphate synthase [Candidatus Stahlbacteria bacterium]